MKWLIRSLGPGLKVSVFIQVVYFSFYFAFLFVANLSAHHLMSQNGSCCVK